MVVGAILAGYISCLLQHGLGSSLFSKKQSSSSKPQNHTLLNKPTLVVESLKEDAETGWPSPGRLLSDLAKFAVEAIGAALLNLLALPRNLLPRAKGLTPLKDNLVMPEDKSEPPISHKPPNSATMESAISPNINTDSSIRHQKGSKPPKLKDLSKHRSTKRLDYTEFYSADSTQIGSKGQKDRSRHRHRDKSGELGFAGSGTEPKSVEAKTKEYNEAKFGQYSMNSKYGADGSYRF